MTLCVFVPGRPAPQGSKRYLGKGIVVESSKAKVDAWRADVRAASVGLVTDPMTGPLAVHLVFYMPRPASTPKRWTPFAVKRPDVDKLARAVLDALGSAGVWVDDSQVVELHAAKRLTRDGGQPGCSIAVDRCTNRIFGDPDPRQVTT